MLALVSLLVVQASAYLAPDGTAVIPGASSYNGLGLVPQMGWDNCELISEELDRNRTDFSLGNAFGCNINESILLDTANAMANYGLRDLGYNYVVLDDCWSSGRNSSGYLVEDTNKFPNVRMMHRIERTSNY
jgi:alpha-galactosidase